ncbi:helix-turn-helix domain-containing protein [uncultured Roseibium sp.]|uniref:helix-turn-helix domain-containing protein n=1 Tax=uncultured Roseibium sp. TaxID=1936171 RepID=UPI002608C50B|nr:helix-turn-helix domain-containing protein [uncultured Roseibium sp.]
MSLIPTKNPEEAILFGSLVTPRTPARAALIASRAPARKAQPVKRPARVFFDPENQPRGMVGRMLAGPTEAQANEVLQETGPEQEEDDGKTRLDGFEFLQFLTLLRIVADEELRKLEDTKSARQTMREIATQVCVRHGTTLEMLRSPQRHRFLCRTRFEAMYLMRVKTSASLIMIGKFFNRDHTSVLHATERHAEEFGLPRPWAGKGEQ